ncbi:MAG: hypothetical protein JWO03_463 [Bacteroidetes bacterium]|nr:hypothetical protein [Bacteroidota bacterium]
MNTSDLYWELLNNLNRNTKLELISRLAGSLRSQDHAEETSLSSLYGAFQSSKSAEEIINEIRSDRSFRKR